MKHVLIIEAPRTGYCLEQIRRTMTVGQLKQTLEDFDDDTPIFFSHDNGYTYGGLIEENIDEKYLESED